MRIKGVLFLLTLVSYSFAQSADERIKERIDSLKLTIETQYNDEVRSAVYELIGNFGGKTSKAISQYLIYKEELDSVFAANNTPREFALAAVSLTYFNAFYDDDTGCEGPFKMRYNVAKSIGLHISNYVDERRNVLKAADAFCKELNSIYFKSDDWRVAYAVYCSGTIEWQKAKMNSEDMENDFWLINGFLPTVHKAAYPMLIAANYIADYYWVHGIEVNVKQIKTQVVEIKKYTTLNQLAHKLNLDVDTLRQLNPIYKKDIIPESHKQYTLVLPAYKVEEFIALGDEVYNYTKAEEVVKPDQVILEPVNSNKEPEVKQEETKTAEIAKKQLIYRVKKGDYLGLIADLYDCRISEIRSWNGIRGNIIDINQKLVIFIDEADYNKYKHINTMTAVEKRRAAAMD